MAHLNEDPYAVSSDSDDDSIKKPPPKINIEGHTTNDFKKIKESLIAEKSLKRDEKTFKEIEELKQIKAEELNRFKKEFEQGTVKNSSEVEEPNFKMTIVERPLGIDKQTLNAFKNKFENIDSTLETNLEERLQILEKKLEGVGKENLAYIKTLYENLPNKEFTKEQIEELVSLQRSDYDKRRLLAAFTQSEKKEELKDCYICNKIVYPVEKIVTNKRLYHIDCFKCATCGKKLSFVTFDSHKGELYCRPHMLKVLHPERVEVIENSELDDGDPIHIEEDDEYVVTSKPKQLAEDVVRAGNSNIGQELQQLKSTLQGKKQNWQHLTNELSNFTEKSSPIIVEEIGSGTVKANLNKFISAVDEEIILDNEEKQRQLEAIREQVSEVKNKWKTGALETAEIHEANTKNELEELKNGLKVSERFSERKFLENNADFVKSYDCTKLDTSHAAEARRSFLEGAAFQSSPVEKPSVSELNDLKFEGLKSFKDKFEKGENEFEANNKSISDIGVELKIIKQALEKSIENLAEMSPEARAERKKQEIEAEFLRYKLARKLQSKRQIEERNNEQSQTFYSEEVTPFDKVKSIKHHYEDGEAFKSTDATQKTEFGVDVKLAGKAREKFKNIEAQSSQALLTQKLKIDSTPSKWDKQTKSVAEIVNKKPEKNNSSDEEDCFDVKNLMNKFKNLENISPNKIERNIEELEALHIEAKNLRQQFEQNVFNDLKQNKEKKCQLENEFKYLKEERNKAKHELEEERKLNEDVENHKEKIEVAADHALKMTAKWEKINKKEAKKAQKLQLKSNIYEEN